MSFFFLTRVTTLSSLVNPRFLLRVCSSSSRVLNNFNNEHEEIDSSSVNDKKYDFANYNSRLHLSPLFSDNSAHLEGCNIEIVDAETWRISSGLAEAWQGMDRALETKGLVSQGFNEMVNYAPANEDEAPDFDEIEDMRIRGNLFYKLDRDSKEFEEYSLDFHRRKSSKIKVGGKERKMKENPSGNLASRVEKSSKNRSGQRGFDKGNLISRDERLLKVDKNDYLISSLHEMDSFCVGKKQRTPTFNQLTAPYHEPFCLDIYISKASVRACIVHRATSNVVAVAHSISKDMKFDLTSTKNATACAAVGAVLAQRALDDDIHNVVYTPRNGERLEGKLQIVLQSVIDNGIDVKVKIKQRNAKKAGLPVVAKEHC